MAEEGEGGEPDVMTVAACGGEFEGALGRQDQDRSGEHALRTGVFGKR